MTETIKEGKTVFRRETPAAAPSTAEPELVGTR